MRDKAAIPILPVVVGIVLLLGGAAFCWLVPPLAVVMTGVSLWRRGVAN